MGNVVSIMIRTPFAKYSRTFTRLFSAQALAIAGKMVLEIPVVAIVPNIEVILFAYPKYEILPVGRVEPIILSITVVAL